MPLLAPGMRAASKLGRWLAVALFLGPVTLSLAVMIVFGPHALLDNVLGYRSISGYFGITGLLDLAHLHGVTRVYSRLFTLVLIAGVLVLSRVLWNRGLDGRRAILLAGLVLLAIPAIGPGWAPQYAYWFMPPLIASYPLFDDGWRRILLVAYAVAAVTFVVDYGLIDGLGHFFNHFFGDTGFLRHLSKRISTPGAETVERLPLFACSVVVLVAGCRRMRTDPRLERDAVEGDGPAGFRLRRRTSSSFSGARGSCGPPSSQPGRSPRTPTISTAGERSRRPSRAERIRTSRRRSSSGRRSRSSSSGWSTTSHVRWTSRSSCRCESR